MQNNPQIRKFIRHPSDVPLQVSTERVADRSEEVPCKNLNNVSLGGLAFNSSDNLAPGECVSVCFPLLDQKRCLTGRVVWSRPSTSGFDIGVQFEGADELYSLRMIEQVCHIEHYRREVEQSEGRQLTSEEAASEWIQRYADRFPELDS